ncbi:MAG TPA: EAL domain-containing protein [Steroidobacteraceae bacterium]|nr:EAL domain-containing protein [Steroidobacteraceae bacterium]
MRKGWELAGLGSRVATRTFLIFAACLSLPAIIAAIALNAYVSQQAERRAHEELLTRAKNFGFLLFERLKDTEEDLNHAADLVLAGKLSVEQLYALQSKRFHVTNVLTQSNASTSASSRVEVIQEAGAAKPTILVTRANDRSSLTIHADIDPDYLWDTDAVASATVGLCVRRGTDALHCASSSTASEMLRANWALFLRARFATDDWTIEASQDAASALATVDDFKRILPLATIGIIFAASLLTVVYLRRSHRPLATLAKAAENIGRRRFDQQVTVESDDEFGKLAHVFNRMSANLGHQFGLMSLLARIDRMILRDPPVNELLQTVLPQLPTLLRAQAVIVAVQSGGDICMYRASRNTSYVNVSRMDGDQEFLHRLLTQDDQANGLAALMQSKSDRTGRIPIEVLGNVRGALIFVNSSSATRPGQLRHARAFASRFAVALGTEERRRALIQQAYYDGLTGLPNRQLFSDRIARALINARAQGTQIALIYIDLDRFQTINDSLGHSAGDELIKVVASRLASLVRDSDTVARIGGDEFVVITHNLVEHQLRLMAERIQAALREPLTIRDVSCSVQGSLGIALFPNDAQSAETLLRNADIAANRAKAAGGAQIVFFEERMDREAMHRLNIEQRLRRALEQKSLQLAFQPKVRISDMQICGVEALARWTDEEFGEVSPAVFIPIAEECGLIERLGEWALREACLQFQQWRRERIEVDHVSVNVSVRQLRSPTFVSLVLTILDSTGTPARALELEVTESTLASNPAPIYERLQQLRDAGIRIAIDDFGTGYSSLAAICEMPADTLKIDRTFVKDSDSTERAAAILQAIASMAHALGKTTVAEGVETKAQLAALKRVGADFVQGYLIARPLSSASLVDFVRSHRGSISSIVASAEESGEPSRSNVVRLSTDRAR